jgi:hypothetical protein
MTKTEYMSSLPSKFYRLKNPKISSFVVENQFAIEEQWVRGMNVEGNNGCF